MKDFSIVVPVFYKEEGQSALTGITEIYQTLKKFRSNYIKKYELIVVVDGDNHLLATQIRAIDDNIKVIEYKNHRGKGYALIQGFKKSTGKYITFIDCDGDIRLKQIFNFFPYLATADIVIGSKRHPFSKIDYPLSRRILSRGFQIISWIILGSSLRDTQSGLKVMKREVLDVIVDSIRIDHFTFDLEMCFLAQRHGFRVVEAPIEIKFQHNSSIRLTTIFKMFWDIIRIRFWFTFSHSYQKKFIDKFFK